MKNRQSTGCVVYRQGANGVEVLIVTSTSGKNWVFPKGGIEPLMSPEESAVKEVREEAGVVCKIDFEFEMPYRYMKNSVLQFVRMYRAAFSHEFTQWDEMDKRLRQWVSIDVALDMVDEYLAPYLLDLQVSLKDGI